MSDAITFHVPASAANLGSGYGVVGLALDMSLGITVEPRTDGEVVVERRDDPSAHLEDSRHDPVLRGFRRGAELLGANVKKGVTIVVEGTIPRGTGMGTISGGFAAGFGAAARLAKKTCTPSEALDALVPLGADPGHAAAALGGGLSATATLSAPRDELEQRVLPQPIHQDWHYVIALPDLGMGTAETKRVLPPTLPHAATTRAIGRTLAVLRALESGDEELLGRALLDEIHVPYRRPRVPGLGRAMTAARDAGAAGATICGHGPGTIAFTTTSGRSAAIATAMVEAFADAGQTATTLTLATAFYGALPTSTG
ncbi:MAG: hypothetical protein NXI31_09140 [bacterium]|nr:hypothetical protein [bacterium]